MSSKPSAASRKGRGGGRGSGRGGRGRSGGGRGGKDTATEATPNKNNKSSGRSATSTSKPTAVSKSEVKPVIPEKPKIDPEELKAQQELQARTTAIQDAVHLLKSTVADAKARSTSRDLFSIPENINAARSSFEQRKKTLKSDLKKCTTFVKKVKSGTLYSCKPAEVQNDVAALNLSRYVDEITSALLESKPKVVDLPVVLALCQSMHERYPDFLSTLLPTVWNIVAQSPSTSSSSSSSGNNAAKKGAELAEQTKSRRFFVRFLVDVFANGLLSDADSKKLIQCLAEWTGAAMNYTIQDAVAFVAFGKQASFEILSTTPTSIRKAIELLREEISKTTSEEVSSELMTEAKVCLEDIEPILKVTALPAEVSGPILAHCRGAYKTLSSSLVQTHNKLQKLEKRCEQDRLLSGQLTAVREKGLVDARKLCDSLQKSVEALSDCLDQTVPQLVVEEENSDAVCGAGVEVWTKEAGGTEDLGPFDDEETRAFYFDIPDLLTTIPPALLGISEEEIERRKEANKQKYGRFNTVADSDADTAPTETSEAQFDALERGELPGEEEEGASADAEPSNQDTPHFKLSLLLEQELPECNRREQIDELSEKFCTNHGSSKTSRKRLLKSLFFVPRTRLDLLPYYSRMTATLDRVWPDIAPNLVNELEQQFHGQTRFKKAQNLDGRMRTARYIGELTKFRIAPPIVALRCLRRCIEDFSGYNVEVSCALLESCGRFLYRTSYTNEKMSMILDAMSRLSKAKNHDERLQSLLKSAFFSVKPPASGPRKKAKEYPPLEAYLRHLLLVKLEPTDASISLVTRQLIRFPWNDPKQHCGSLVCRIMLKACRNGRYKAIEAVASVAARLRTQRAAGETTIRLIDALLEELRWALENPTFKDQQRTITYSRLLGELYRTNQVPGRLIIDQLYEFLNVGHEIPDALRQASKEIESLKEKEQTSEDKLPVYNSASGVSSAIQEDEELEDTELDTKLNDEAVKPVAVSQYSKYDPRVPSAIDPPNSSYRITLICTVLEVVARSLVSRNNLPRLKGLMASLQRYLFTKGPLPTDVEFALLDTFDIIDSQWKRITKATGKNSNTSSENGFPRYETWLDAHNATVEYEEADALFEAQKRSRMENSYDDQKSVASTLDDEMIGSVMGDDDASMSAKSKDTVESDGVVEVGTTSSFTDGETGRQEWVSDDEDETTDDGSAESDEDDDELDEDEDMDEDDEDLEDGVDEFDEELQLQQLEEEEFERELRRLTMDALEKGKSSSRKLVGDSMISGTQVVKRKPADVPKADVGGPSGFTLGGEAGISFQVLKRGNKGKVEAKELVVPVSTNLATVASRQDDAAARERDVIKQRVLRYEEQSAEAAVSGGNVYLEQKELQRNRNKTLSMAEIDKNFGTTGGSLLPVQLEKKPSAAQIQHVHGGSRANPRGGRGRLPGRTGRGVGSGRSSTGRGLFDF